MLDQVTKFWVTLHIPMHYSISIVEGFFNLTHIRNPGVAFGLFARHESEYKALFFIVISIIVIDFIDFFYRGSHWPAFNIADACITIGVSFMIYDLFFGYPKNTGVSSPPSEPVQD